MKLCWYTVRFICSVRKHFIYIYTYTYIGHTPIAARRVFRAKGAGIIVIAVGPTLIFRENRSRPSDFAEATGAGDRPFVFKRRFRLNEPGYRYSTTARRPAPSGERGGGGRSGATELKIMARNKR